jgi:hypothetical protein
LKKGDDKKKAKKGRRGGMIDHLVESSGMNNIALQIDRKQNSDTGTLMKDAILVKLSNEALNIKREHFL